MLPRFLFTALLEGLRPRATTQRRPIPVVWYDRVREPKAVAHLRRLAGEWSSASADVRGGAVGVHVVVGTTSARHETGWAGVVFTEL